MWTIVVYCGLLQLLLAVTPCCRENIFLSPVFIRNSTIEKWRFSTIVIQITLSEMGSKLVPRLSGPLAARWMRCHLNPTGVLVDSSERTNFLRLMNQSSSAMYIRCTLTTEWTFYQNFHKPGKKTTPHSAKKFCIWNITLNMQNSPGVCWLSDHSIRTIFAFIHLVFFILLRNDNYLTLMPKVSAIHRMITINLNSPFHLI